MELTAEKANQKKSLEEQIEEILKSSDFKLLFPHEYFLNTNNLKKLKNVLERGKEFLELGKDGMLKKLNYSEPSNFQKAVIFFSRAKEPTTLTEAVEQLGDIFILRAKNSIKVVFDLIEKLIEQRKSARQESRQLAAQKLKRAALARSKRHATAEAIRREQLEEIRREIRGGFLPTNPAIDPSGEEFGFVRGLSQKKPDLAGQEGDLSGGRFSGKSLHRPSGISWDNSESLAIED